MTYDFYTYNEGYKTTGYNSPLYAPANAPEGDFEPAYIRNVNWSANHWLNDLGAPKEMLLVGIPFYSHGWTLNSSHEGYQVFQPAVGPGYGEYCNPSSRLPFFSS